MSARDPMEQLRTAQPMPRGERLARNRNVPAPKPHRLIQRCSQPLAMAWFVDDVETHAAPLALARERRRRERAEAVAEHARWQRAEVERALSAALADASRWKADALALDAEVRRLREPVEVTGITTREDAIRVALYWRDAAKRVEEQLNALRAGHTCREGDRVDCLACDAYVRRHSDELVRLRADVTRLAVEVDEAGEHGFANRMRELATKEKP